MVPGSFRARWALFGALVIHITGHALADDGFQRVERRIRVEMEKQNIPGLSAAIAWRGEVAWAKGFGLSDIENGVPAKAVTSYRIASISKPITATAVMQLAEGGKLDLDAGIQKYCPAFPEKPWPVTARQLLGHLGGVRHYNGAEMKTTNMRRFESINESLSLFKDDPLTNPPGDAFTYTTYGYNVLGCAVEGASAMTFLEYLKARVFGPAGMGRTGPDDGYAIIPHRAQGYRRAAGRLLNAKPADTSNKIPGGGMVSTVEDLARFAIAVQRLVIVSKGGLAMMTRGQKTKDGTDTGYGLGWVLGVHRGDREVFHTGGQDRVSNILYTLPDSAFAVALLSNLEGARLQDLARDIIDIVKSMGRK